MDEQGEALEPYGPKNEFRNKTNERRKIQRVRKETIRKEQAKTLEIHAPPIKFLNPEQDESLEPYEPKNEFRNATNEQRRIKQIRKETIRKEQVEQILNPVFTEKEMGSYLCTKTINVILVFCIPTLQNFVVFFDCLPTSLCKNILFSVFKKCPQCDIINTKR